MGNTFSWRNIPEEDRPPGWLRDEETIDVQVEGLQTFAKALLADLDKNFGPHLPQVYEPMAKHACVGDGMFFAEMDAARQKHYECLTSVVNVLQGYASGTYAVGKGAETVAQNYGNADDMAKVSATEVDHVLKPGTPGQTVHTTNATSTPITTSDSGLTDKGVQ
jgi:hypothetical protein